MDEFEPIRSFRRSDVAPNSAARAAAREQLIAHMEDDHLVDVFSAHLPTPPTKPKMGARSNSGPWRRHVHSAPVAAMRLDCLRSLMTATLALMWAATALWPGRMPFVDRWVLYGVVLCLTAGVIAVALSTSRAIVATAIPIAVLAVLGTYHFVDLSAESAGPAAQAKERRHAKQPSSVRRVGADGYASVHSFGRRWVLHTNGTIEGRIGYATEGLTYRVSGPAAGITACGDALVVTHGHRRVARVDPTTAATLASYSYGWQTSDVVCGGGFVWGQQAQSRIGGEAASALPRVRGGIPRCLAGDLDRLWPGCGMGARGTATCCRGSERRHRARAGALHGDE